MKLVIEVPHLSEDPKAAFAAIDAFDCWSGFSIDESLLEAIEPWEDTIDLTETRWTWLSPCLPSEISGRLIDMDAATQQTFMNHLTQLLRRASVQGVKWTTIDLAVDRLAWPDKLADESRTSKDMERVTSTLKAMRTIAAEYLDGICLSLRLPLPSIASKGREMTLELMRDCANDQCKIFLDIAIDELKTGDPETLFGPYLKYLAGIRLRYEPKLGIRASEKLQQTWADYLHTNAFEGAIIFAPKVESSQRLETELARLAEDVGRLWPR